MKHEIFILSLLLIKSFSYQINTLDILHIQSSDGQPFENFGKNVDIYDDYFVVSSPNYGIDNEGKIYIYETIDGVYKENYEISSFKENSIIGNIISCGQKICFISYSDDSLLYYTYRDIQGIWIQKIFNFMSVPSSISMWGSYVVICSETFKTASIYYVDDTFEINFLVNITKDIEGFGRSVSIYRNTIAVGTLADKVFVFDFLEYNNETISVEITQIENNYVSSIEYGYTINIYNNILTISNHNYGIDNSGSIHIYEQSSNGTFAEIQTIFGTDDTERLGKVHDIFETTLVVGNPFNDKFDIYKYSLENSIYEKKYEYLHNITGVSFAESVSIFNNKLLVGSPNENSQSGKVYLFEFDFDFKNAITNENRLLIESCFSCELINVDLNIMSTIRYNNVNENENEFDLFIFDSKRNLIRNMYISSYETIDCISFTGFYTENNFGIGVTNDIKYFRYMFSSDLLQIDENTCLLSWDYIIPSSVLYSETFFLVFGVKNNTDIDIDFFDTFVSVIPKHTISNIDFSNYNNESIQSPSDYVYPIDSINVLENIDGNVAIQFKYGHVNTSCYSYPENIKINISDCKEINVSIDIDTTPTFSYIYTIPQNKYSECSFSQYSFESKLVYLFKATAYLQNSYSYDYLDANCSNIHSNNISIIETRSIFFNVTIDTEVSDDLVFGIEELSSEIVDYGMIPCSSTNAYIPSGIIDILLKTTTTKNNTLFKNITNKRIGDVNMLIYEFPEDDCVLCYWKLKSEDCIPLNMFESEQTCEFRSTDNIFIQTKYTYDDNNTSTNKIQNPFLTPKTFNSCPEIIKHIDVTSKYGVKLDVSGEFLNDDIIATLSFTEINSDSNVALSIQNVEVSIDDGEYFREYNVYDKLRRFKNTFHPYFSDAHFCRFSSCYEEFYNSSPGVERWNNWCDNHLELFDNNQHLLQCQNMENIIIDKFIFNPSNWVFKYYHANPNIIMHIKVSAVIYLCNSNSLGRLLSENEVVKAEKSLQISLHSNDINQRISLNLNTLTSIGFIALLVFVIFEKIKDKPLLPYSKKKH